MEELFLTPIHIKQPPRHTQIKPKCYTCSRFPICNIRTDYLKTAFLIQNVLGDPQKDRELNYYNSKYGRIPGFSGYNFEQPENYFPEEVVLNENHKGAFMDAKYKNKNLIQFLYKTEGYYVLFEAIWNDKEDIYDFSKGIEIYYGIQYELSSDSIVELAVNLEGWRLDMEEKEEKSKDSDVINTTYFSAQLNCDFYEQEKGLTEEEGIKRIIAAFPNGIPCSDGSYYHLATFHIEPNKVPCYHPENGKVAFAPLPYPVFVPKKSNNSIPPQRRGDFNCE